MIVHTIIMYVVITIHDIILYVPIVMVIHIYIILYNFALLCRQYIILCPVITCP